MALAETVMGEGRVTSRGSEIRQVSLPGEGLWYGATEFVETEVRVWEGLTKAAVDAVLDDPPLGYREYGSIVRGRRCRVVESYSYTGDEISPALGMWTLTRNMERTSTWGGWRALTPPR